VHIHWNSTTIVGNLDPALFGNNHVNVLTVTRQRLIYGVVYDFIDQVVEASWAS
jgi:hypothetical protein